MLLCKNSNNRQERMRAQKNTFHFLAVFGCGDCCLNIIALYAHSRVSFDFVRNPNASGISGNSVCLSFIQKTSECKT